jgi:hypothetical protein
MLMKVPECAQSLERVSSSRYWGREATIFWMVTLVVGRRSSPAKSPESQTALVWLVVVFTRRLRS